MDDLVEQCLAELLGEDQLCAELFLVPPDVRQELESLLRTAVQVRSTLEHTIPDDVRDRIEQRILASRRAARSTQAAGQARSSTISPS